MNIKLIENPCLKCPTGMIECCGECFKNGKYEQQKADLKAFRDWLKENNSKWHTPLELFILPEKLAELEKLVEVHHV